MMLLTGEMWEKAVRYCKEHYSNCHTCEIRSDIAKQARAAGMSYGEFMALKRSGKI